MSARTRLRNYSLRKQLVDPASARGVAGSMEQGGGQTRITRTLTPRSPLLSALKESPKANQRGRRHRASRHSPQRHSASAKPVAATLGRVAKGIRQIAVQK